MTIIQLKYFLSLAETLNFSKVAETYYVAQTGVSYSIKALENELNTKLFDRTTKKVELTPAGRIFYDRIKLAVQMIDNAQTNLQSSPESAIMVIGCSRLCSGPTFYRSVRTFQDQHPELTVVLMADEPELGLLHRLADGEIDVAVYLRNPFTQIPADLVTNEFYARIPRKVIMSNSHRLAKWEGGIPADELRSEQIVSYADLEKTRMTLSNIDAADPLASQIKEAIITTDFHSMLDMISANLGIACIPLIDNLHTESLTSRVCIETPADFPSITASYHNSQMGLSITQFVTLLFGEFKKEFPDGRYTVL